MTYDAIGNMLTKGNISYTWTQGRKLSGVNNGKSIQYYYDHNGARTRKVVDGVATEYRMAGDLLVSEKTGTQTYWYRYDSGANLVSVTIKGKIYFYVKNAQNDVIALVDADGNVVVKYSYDSWGKLLNITGSLADTVGVQNPFRYRGYYYDNETGMYYLHNRYYEPNIKRFICSDEIVTLEASPETLHNRNLFAYCNGNPMSRIDKDGRLWATIIGGIVGAAVSVGTQMIFEGKSFSEINKTEVVCSAISMAVSATGLGMWGQAIVNAGTGLATSIANGDSWDKRILNTAVGFASGLAGGKGGAYEENYRKFYQFDLRMNKIRITDRIERAATDMAQRTKYVSNIKKNVTRSIGVAYGGAPLASNFVAKHYIVVYAHVGPNSSYKQYYLKPVF